MKKLKLTSAKASDIVASINSAIKNFGDLEIFVEIYLVDGIMIAPIDRIVMKEVGYNENDLHPVFTLSNKPEDVDIDKNIVSDGDKMLATNQKYKIFS